MERDVRRRVPAHAATSGWSLGRPFAAPERVAPAQRRARLAIGAGRASMNPGGSRNPEAGRQVRHQPARVFNGNHDSGHRACHMNDAVASLMGNHRTTTRRVAQSMDATALRAELERHHADCTVWAFACCRFDPSEADDVLQATYLKILDGRAVFGGQSAFRTWLFGVVRLTALEHRRRHAWRWLFESIDLDALPQIAPHQTVESEESVRLQAAVAKLPPRQREVLHLVFQQDLSVEDAARVMGVSVGSARVHYARGKQRLRRLMGAEPSP